MENPPPASVRTRSRSLGQHAVRWGLVVLVALGFALLIDLSRTSLAQDRVDWGTLELNANQIVPVSATASPSSPASAERRPLSPASPLADRPRLIRFTADWCGPCQSMKAQVFAKTDVAQAIHRRFNAFSVDLSQPTPEQQALGQRYNVVYLPTLLVTDAQGNEIARLEQAADAADFLQWLDRSWTRWDESQVEPSPSSATQLSPISNDLPIN